MSSRISVLHIADTTHWGREKYCVIEDFANKSSSRKYRYIENIHGFFYLSKLEISGYIHNNQEANLLYRYQLSYKKSKKGQIH
jgi:hypothetical protein